MGGLQDSKQVWGRDRPSIFTRRYGCWLRCLAFTCLYVLCTALSSLYLSQPNDVTLFWPASGVGLVALVLFGIRSIGLVPVAIVLHHLLIEPVSWAFLPWSIAANTFGTLAGAAYVLKAGRALRAGTQDGMLMFRGGVILSFVSACIGSLGMLVVGNISLDQLLGNWTLWLLANILGVCAIGPALMFFLVPLNPETPRIDTQRWAGERVAWTVCLLITCGVLYIISLRSNPYLPGLLSLPLMLLTWSAQRFSLLFTATATFIVISFLSFFTGSHIGQVHRPNSVGEAVFLTLTLILLAIIPNLLASSRMDSQRNLVSLRKRATEDRLTGLPNREVFEDQARSYLERVQEPLALLYIDLDHFKLVNDAASHAAGDHVVTQIARGLQRYLPEGALLARTGGDEFCILAAADENAAVFGAQKILDKLQSVRFDFEGQSLSIAASVGVACSVAPHASFDTLLSRADSSCFIAKELGGNRVHVFNSNSDETRSRSASMRSAMRVHEALQQQQFELYAQPIVPLQNGHDLHFEALLRWRDPDGRIHSAANFILAAERYRLGTQVDRYMVDALLDWYERHPQAIGNTSCSVNISGASVVDKPFTDYIAYRLRRSRLPANQLCIEITETSAVRDRKRAAYFIEQLRSLGCRFALDDFGTGFCSFGYLRELDVDYLKIDGSFVRGLETSPLSHAVVQSITQIAHVLNMRTVAEQVETEAQMQIVRDMGVDYGQGWAFAKAMPMAQYLSEWVLAEQHVPQ